MNMNFGVLKKTIEHVAKKLNACDDFLAALEETETESELIQCIQDHHNFVSEVSIHAPKANSSMNPQKIIAWLDSPFVSDYDKNLVKEKLGLK
jgi:hypothetical protein